MKQINLRMNIGEYILLFKIIHAWIFKGPPGPYASESEHTAGPHGQCNGHARLSVVPCLLTTLAVLIILYHGLYKNWMDRCLHSGSTARKVPSEQQRHQGPDDDITNDNIGENLILSAAA